MPTLLELQRCMGLHLLQGIDGEASAFIVNQGVAPEDRLQIYRNTSMGVMASALRLVFVAVGHVLGAEFFEGAARMFVAEAPPRSAWLDQYGADFPDFLAQLPQAASVPYVADLARLEWSVNLVLHASDAMPLAIADLAGLTEADLSQLRLVPHPTAQLLRCDFPADAIWHAVLERDDDAMAAVDLSDGPVGLLVQRTAQGIELMRLSEPQWSVATALFLGQPLGAVMAGASGPDAHAALATLLTRECFMNFSRPHEVIQAELRRSHT